MNVCVKLFAFAVIVGVVACGTYNGRRRLPNPVPHPKPLPVPLPKPVPSTCLTQTLCGGFVQAQCPLGYKCRYRPGADFGDCCPAKQDPCFGRGLDGICGGFGNQQCRPGTLCTSIGLDPAADGHGVCCITEPIIKPPVLGKCPPPSGLFTTCEFDPSRNCLTDSECGQFKRCCSEGCGKICKWVFQRRG